MKVEEAFKEDEQLLTEHTAQLLLNTTKEFNEPGSIMGALQDFAKPFVFWEV